MPGAWPPREWASVLEKLSDWDAWLSGDRDALEGSAHRYGPVNPSPSFAQRVVERVYRKFWGSPPSPNGPQTKLHVPLAADIARASSDLLFAEPPAVKARKPKLADVAEGEEQPPDVLAAMALAARTQDRLDRYLEDGLISTLAEAAELGAGLGGVYLRVTWTTDDRRVFLTKVDADAALPEFRWGRLQRVTFWRDLSEPGAKPVYRHLETHELRVFADGELPEGIVRHELYQGTASELGNVVPLVDHPATRDLAPLLEPVGDDGEGIVRTHSPGLAVEYVPNVRPNTVWRKVAVAASLGAADIAQCEDLLDQLDATYSSLMRDLALAKARITVPEGWLETDAPGKGVRFDADRELFVGLVRPPTDDQARPELFQPAIRVTEHLATMQQLVEDVLRRAGYSAATFGEDEDGNAATATEINARTGRSRLTRQRKLRYWQPAVEKLIRKMMAVDLYLGTVHRGFGFAEDVDPDLVAVEFPVPAMSGIELANMVAAWNTAQAASIEIRVRTIHPEWDDDAVKDEVARLKAELGAAVENPEEFRPRPTAFGPEEPEIEEEEDL